MKSKQSVYKPASAAAKIKKLSKRQLILFTVEEKSWRNLWLLFRRPKKELVKYGLAVGYTEFANGKRENYWINELGTWSSSKTPNVEVRKELAYLLDLMNITNEPIQLDITKIKL